MKLFTCLLPPALLLACQTQADSDMLEEVTVTAELRATSLQQQPVSTSVLTGSMLRERAAQHLEQVLNVIPNLNYAGGTSRARFFQIRGIGERSQFQEPLNPSIGLLLDGVDFSGLGTIGTLFDVEQVEVLRGPQGTLHGANALAGLVNIRSAAPEASPGLELQGSMAEYDSWDLGVVTTGPLVSDTLLYRIAVQQYRSDGYIKNDFLGRDDTSDRDETSIRGRLRWLPGDHDSVDLTLLHADIDNGYDVFSLDNNRRTLSDQPGRDRQASTALSLHWQGQRDAVDFETLLTAATTDSEYSYDEDWTYVGIAPELEYSSFDRFDRDRDSFSAQLRLLSNEQSHLFNGRGQWVAGLYYLADREQLQRQYTYLAEDFFSDYDADTAAVFGQLDTALSDRATLIAGLRLERRETDYRDSNSIAGDTARTLWGARLVLEYQYRESAMLYGGVSRGYRGSGVNTNILSGLQTTDDPELLMLFSGLQSFDEETLLNYEVGHKGEYLEGRLRSRLALFYMDRNDQQVKGSLVVPREDDSTQFIDYTSNAARGTNYGLELELEWLATEQLSLYANLGLLDTSFDRYIRADDEDLAGHEQAHAPSYQVATGGRLDLSERFYLRADVEAKDSFYFSDRHELRANAHALLHLRLGYERETWEVALWARNLTDRNYTTRGFGSFGNDSRNGYVVEPYTQLGEPRVVGVSASYSFQ